MDNTTADVSNIEEVGTALQPQRKKYFSIDENNKVTAIVEGTGVSLEDGIEADGDTNSILGYIYNPDTKEFTAPDPVDEEPTEDEIIQAEILLNQLEIQEKLEEQEVILAEILLNSL